MVFSGTSLDGKLVEAIEIPDHPFFVGTQFHPEYNIEEANEIFDLISEQDPLFSQYYSNALVDEIQLNQNEQIIVNFLSLSTD